MSKEKPTVLVTGVGAIIGYGIINALRQSGRNIRIVGMDIYDDAYGRNLVDQFVKAEPAKSPGYIEFVKEVVRQMGIDLIIPGIEQDLYALHKNRVVVESFTKIVMNNDLCIALSENKLTTYEYLKGKGINLIPTLSATSYDECVQKLSVPFLVKPKAGYASKGINLITCREDFVFYSEKLKNECIYQKIIGTKESEYTVSVFGDGSGSFSDSIILRRQLSGEGATSKATLVEDNEFITTYVRSLCGLLKPLGPTNIQLRMEENTPYLLEINPRISSACSIRAALGYNEPEMCLDYFMFDKLPVAKPKRKGSVIRYISDHVTYE